MGQYKVPRGTEVHVSAWCLHRNEQWWQQAEAFKPERWIGDPTGGDRTGGRVYMPFGAGPRTCIGYKLARELYLLQLVFATLVTVYAALNKTVADIILVTAMAKAPQNALRQHMQLTHAPCMRSSQHTALK